jgi:type IV pilus assembly protein PilM
MLDRIRALLTDPPPAHAFEFSPAGIAWFAEGRTGFEPLPEGALKASPLEDNFADPAAVESAFRRIAPPDPRNKIRPCVAILPDFCARLTVLDFDNLPGKREEQASLIRFRLKRTLPFDVDAAALSFETQPGGAVVAAVSFEILARYEQLLRSAGFHPGLITLSTLAALDGIAPSPGWTVWTRVSDRVLSIAAMENERLRLTRFVELSDSSEDEIASVVEPTLAYLEDEFGATDARVLRSERTNDAGLAGYLSARKAA